MDGVTRTHLIKENISLHQMDQLYIRNESNMILETKGLLVNFRLNST